ncbi:type III-B CRISPR module RAMP protein Cmr1 [Thermomonospora cellulosilytica]|uniref:CRISPR-associated protein Cmr1 n=1 Tax=Thermomonospora cellulosilytica TaxID=1411118 RepID=A0A7W3N4D1_9ACTN|nr:type III-B CRISPR module RAMP protein Cmr1 [Thermomonospora cellulosilytica]MBA9007287.1 CRISPR-associated protein Cmr1 [Thermomonospora cellulosilytica]
MAWTTLNLKVTTPLFSSGADQESVGDTGIRVPSLRGAMRFWFRALAGSRTGTGPDGLKLLAAMERRVFGGPGVPSACVLRIPAGQRIRVVSTHQRHGFINPDNPADPSKWIVYLLGQGLGDLGRMDIKRPYVAPNSTFQLMIRFNHRRADPPEVRDAVTALACLSLWLACAFGGLGARTRRGFGGLRITEVTGGGLPWEPETLLTPGLDYYENLSGLDAAHVLAPFPGWDEHLDVLSAQVITDSNGGFRPSERTGPPAFPVLSGPHTAMALSQGEPFPAWDKALIEAGNRLRIARARIKAPGARYDPPRKTWEWLNVVHGEETTFDLAALGLPVVFNKDVSVNAVQDGQELRRASMVWLRPVGDPEGRRCRLLSMAFLTEFLPEGARIRLRHNGEPDKDLDVTTPVAIARARRWMDRPITYKPPGGSGGRKNRR